MRFRVSKRAGLILAILIVLVGVFTVLDGNRADFCKDTAKTGIPQHECEALVAMSEAVEGWQARPEPLKKISGIGWVDEGLNRLLYGWASARPTRPMPCYWYGVFCENGHVGGIVGEWLTMKSLPKEIGQLSHMRTLAIYDNEFTALPSEIGNLTNLQELYLANNPLTALPPEIGNLSNLEWLILSDNQLTRLPPKSASLST